MIFQRAEATRADKRRTSTNADNGDILTYRRSRNLCSGTRLLQRYHFSPSTTNISRNPLTIAHIKDVLCRTAEKFSRDKDCTRITKMSLSDEWISLYNRDEKDGKLDVEVEVAVNATFELQFKKPSKNENKEANVIDDRLLCVLNEFSVLAHGHAMCNYWNYE